MIIGLSGKAQVGKDTVAKIICCLTSKDEFTIDFLKEDPLGCLGVHSDFRKNWNGNYDGISKWQIRKFAFAVKQICSILTGIPELESEEIDESVLLDEVIEY